MLKPSQENVKKWNGWVHWQFDRFHRFFRGTSAKKNVRFPQTRSKKRDPSSFVRKWRRRNIEAKTKKRNQTMGAATASLLFFFFSPEPAAVVTHARASLLFVNKSINTRCVPVSVCECVYQVDRKRERERERERELSV